MNITWVRVNTILLLVFVYIQKYTVTFVHSFIHPHNSQRLQAHTHVCTKINDWPTYLIPLPAHHICRSFWLPICLPACLPTYRRTQMYVGLYKILLKVIFALLVISFTLLVYTVTLSCNFTFYVITD